ncbi:DUF2510 domain-containing protein [Iamia sp.]|uniref:DUF2510 domain-containing protein n=1 Tax=Iamia sp. TaxID=2722710 RepID=UPI002D7EC8B9|nr:DUF2510 domain-containing protein [Iamia sp.]
MSDDTPAGWYQAGDRPGQQRYHDGSGWTDHYAPIDQPTQQQYPQQGAYPVQPQKKGGFPKWLIPVIACLGLVFIAVIGGAIAGSPDEEADEATTTTEPDGFAKCNDGSISDNTDLRAICSSHDGVSEWLSEYGECADGTVIALRDDPQCPSGGDLAKLLPGYEPEVGPDDIALCKDGTFSDNLDLAATCSSHAGVEDWLADYGRCEGGEVIRLEDGPRCPGGEDLAELMPTDYVPPTTTEPPATTAPPTTTAPPATAAPADTYEAGNYTFADVQVSSDFVDDFSVRARATNNGDTVESASFAVTLFAGGSVVGTGTAFVSNFEAGSTITVEFISIDDFTEHDEVEFQVESEF